MKYLVTGATGHLGANLVRRLLADGHEVRALLRDGGDHDARRADDAAVAGLDVEVVHGDVRDLDAMRAAARGVQGVFHTAARVSTLEGDERAIYDTNVAGTRHVLKAAREAGVRRVVVTGSLSAVGHNPDRPSNEDDPFYPYGWHLPYARSKAWVEHECLKAVALGQEVVIAVSCAILGPNDFIPSRMGRVVKDFANGAMRAYIPGGFDFVAASDIVRGPRPRHGQGAGRPALHLQHPLRGGRRADGHPGARHRDAASGAAPPPAVMAGVAHVSSFVLGTFFPKVPQRFTPAAVRLLQMRRRADTSRAQSELGYRPTSIEDALREAYEHFVQRGEITAPRVPVRAPAVSAAAIRPSTPSSSTGGGCPVAHGARA